MGLGKAHPVNRSGKTGRLLLLTSGCGLWGVYADLTALGLNPANMTMIPRKRTAVMT